MSALGDEDHAGDVEDAVFHEGQRLAYETVLNMLAHGAARARDVARRACLELCKQRAGAGAPRELVRLQRARPRQPQAGTRPQCTITRTPWRSAPWSS